MSCNDVKITGISLRSSDDSRNDESHLLDIAEKQLCEYFRGERHEFSLPTQAVGTPFQKNVWSALSRVPYGTVVTYSELAALAGRPSAARAVGSALGRNPLRETWLSRTTAIIWPCHRVVAASSLGGFSAGLDWKKKLLLHEGILDEYSHTTTKTTHLR